MSATGSASIRFALNRTCAPQMALEEFLSMARAVRAPNVEIRNDIAGQEFANGLPAAELGAFLRAEGIGLASVNALQRFNDWTPERAAEARATIGYAAALGAPGLVLCPVIDESDPWDEPERARHLRAALRVLRPILEDHGITGFVEPLGMKGSTLKRQRLAVEAVDDIDGWAHFRICHDTFQYFRCGDTRMYSEHIGLVHISGIVRGDLAPEDLTEPDRGFVFADDRAGTVDQLNRLIAGGYRGVVSMEPFSPEVQTDPAIVSRLGESLAYVASGIRAAEPADGFRRQF